MFCNSYLKWYDHHLTLPPHALSHPIDVNDTQSHSKQFWSCSFLGQGANPRVGLQVNEWMETSQESFLGVVVDSQKGKLPASYY